MSDIKFEELQKLRQERTICIAKERQEFSKLLKDRAISMIKERFPNLSGEDEISVAVCKIWGLKSAKSPKYQTARERYRKLIGE